MAKVMENLIRQNFEKNIFSQFSTVFPVMRINAGFMAVVTGFWLDFLKKKPSRNLPPASSLH
ncbi:MAG: hypothetical protein Q8R50_01520, partial [Sediminibacterium sp.]|nr:hypothetical protein [Sediminibacterium sp.]